MKITVTPRLLQIDGARIIFRNFAGRPSDYNAAGDRNFAVVIPDQDIADALIAEGYNVKIRAPRDADDAPLMHLPVKVGFNSYGPNVYLISGNNRRQLFEEDVEMLDKIDILNVDMDLRPHDWSRSGRSGRTAWLQTIEVTQRLDRFAARYAGEESEE